MIVMKRRKKTVLGADRKGEEIAVFDNQIEHENHLADSSSQIPL